MTLERINPRSWPGRRLHARGARAHRTGSCFLAGQTALDAEGRIVGDGVVAQFEQALGNLLTALRAAGGEPQHLATLTIYAVDLADYRAHAREIGAVWRRLVGTDYPAMAGIGDRPALGRRGAGRGAGHRGAARAERGASAVDERGGRGRGRASASRALSSPNRSAAPRPVPVRGQQRQRQTRGRA